MSSSFSSSGSSSSSSRSSSPSPAPPPSEPAPSLKRKRTGATRAAAKQAAIERALAHGPAGGEGGGAGGLAGGGAAAAAGHGGRENGAGVKRRKVGSNEQAMEADDADAPGEQGGEEQPTEAAMDVDGVVRRIPQALKTLHTALKKIKVAETQRLIKKLRFLRSKAAAQSEVDDLEKQLEELKHLDIHPLPAHLLHLKLRKHPAVQRLPAPDAARILGTAALAPATSAAAASDAGPLDERVRNRLYSAKGVAGAVPGVLGWVVGSEGAKLVRGGGGASVGVGKGKGRVDGTGKGRADGGPTSEGAEAPVKQGKAAPPTLPVKKARADDAPDGGAFVDVLEDQAADAAGWESGSVDDAGSDGELGDSDADSDEDKSKDRRPALTAQPAKPARASKAAPKAAPTRAPAKPITSNLFLPSLSTGYTLGDGSDFSDPEEDERRDRKKGVGAGVERKNRRGQRERRAIWEKKYGANASHVKKQQEEEKQAELAKMYTTAQTGKWTGKAAGDAGWGQRAGAAKGPVGAASRGAPAARAAPSAMPAAAAATAAASSAAVDKAKTMHPSWEAARLRKEKEQALATAPKAKKIVFD